ncbi:hypothetical protein EIP86_004666 [Pleurotus ostreatoroseus]|nr:hypothetical protein EIP86_004666 [Pleurotus ostreatoroseus]
MAAARHRASPATDQVPKKLFIDDHRQEDMYVYVALNTESIPDKKPELQPHTVLNHFDMYHAHYLYDQFHWMAFMPETLEFEGRILGCLKYTRSDVPYVTVRGNDHGTAYGLPEWMLKNLDALWNVITILHQSLTRLRPIALSLNTRIAPSPQSCGYDRLFSEPEDLKDTYIQAREFFTFHLCYVSYLICFCTPSEDTRADRPSWFAQLEESGLIDISIYNDLKDTWVFDLAIPRLGGFVDMDKGASSDPNVRRAPGVPFWLLYTPSNSLPEDDDRFVVAREFQPKYEELSTAVQENLHEKTAERKTISWDHGWSGGIDKSIARYYVNEDDDNLMDFDTGTQQFCFIDFFQAYDYAGSPLSFGVSFPETNYRPQTTEALQNGATLPHLLAHATKSLSPSLAHAKKWFPLSLTHTKKSLPFPFAQTTKSLPFLLDHGTKSLLLARATKSLPLVHAARSLLLLLSHAKKLLPLLLGRAAKWLSLSLHHAARSLPFPLAHAARSLPFLLAHMSEAFSFLLTPANPRNPFPSAHSTTSKSHKLLVRRNTRAHGHHTDFQPRPVKVLNSPCRSMHKDLELESESIQDVMKYRYGLHSTTVPLSLKLHVMLSWIEVERALGIDEDKDHIPAEIQHCVQVFVSCLKDNRYPPLEICDIVPGSPLPHPLAIIDKYLDVIKVDGGYVISSVVACAQDVSWRIFIPHASTLFEIARRGYIQSKGHIVSTLLARGLSFRTIREAPTLASNITIPPTIKRTVTTFGHEFSLEDYWMYEERRNSLLAQPRGRAALMKGGIVWRLALEVLDEEVVSFTSGNPQEFRFSVNIGDSYFVDDELTESELGVIVGVNHVATSRYAVDNDGDASNISWWPRHTTWQQSKYNVGHWTWKCEMWFRNRRNRILEGKATPMTQTKWRSALKGNVNAGKLRTAWDAHCEAAYSIYHPQQT